MSLRGSPESPGLRFCFHPALSLFPRKPQATHTNKDCRGSQGCASARTRDRRGSPICHMQCHPLSLAVKSQLNLPNGCNQVKHGPSGNQGNDVCSLHGGRWFGGRCASGHFLGSGVCQGHGKDLNLILSKSCNNITHLAKHLFAYITSFLQHLRDREREGFLYDHYTNK